jgi:IclR family acetate operon transcriptional repressor
VRNAAIRDGTRWWYGGSPGEVRKAKDQPTLIGSVQRALRLLEAVSGHANGAPAKQLARETQLALGTTYHLLRTLVHEGYLNRLNDGGYVLGDRLDALHQDSRNQAMLSRIRPTLTALRDELSAPAYLSFYEDGEIRVIDVVDGPRTPRVDLWVGFQDAGHATAVGKCVLGHLGDAARRDYLARHPLYDLTPNTITRAPDLLRRLDAERRSGLALDREEYAVGTSCAAVLVTDGTRVGALGISVPAMRFSRLQASQERLAAAAARVTRTLSLTV